MGLGNFLRSTIGGAAAGLVTGGPLGALRGGLTGAVSSLGGGGGGSAGGGRVTRQLPAPTGPTRNIARQLPRGGRGSRRDSTGVSVQLPSVNVPGIGGLTGPSVDFSRVTTQDDTLQTGPASPVDGGGGMMANFQQGLMMSMLQKKIRSKSGRAILEAMVSGSINEGLITEPDRLETRYGDVRHQSPPGFRTVTLNGQKLSVFKPLAMALNLLPKRSKAKISAADMKTIRRAKTLTKRIKGVAKDTGRLKVTNK